MIKFKTSLRLFFIGWLFFLHLGAENKCAEQCIESMALSTRDYSIMMVVQATHHQADIRYVVFRVYSAHTCPSS